MKELKKNTGWFLLFALLIVFIIGSAYQNQSPISEPKVLYDVRYALDADSGNIDSATIFIDADAIDSMVFKIGTTNGIVAIQAELRDSLKAGSDPDNLTFWLKTAYKTKRNANYGVQGDSIPLASGVALLHDSAGSGNHNAVILSITRAFADNANEADELMDRYLCLYVKNVSGAAADSAHLSLFMLNR